MQSGRSLRGDIGSTSDVYALQLIDNLGVWGLEVVAVVITRFTGQEAALGFANKLERRGLKVYKHKIIDGYPNNIENIVS
ncbi:MAG: DUF1846 family protein, partial [Candidatus Omnitrophota bacterium]|nr:DUF1846 family protein [Candidatus Omnitrophota bacterium]